MAQSEDFQEMREREKKAFNSTFSCLASSLEELSFRRYDAEKGKHLGGFLISAFEPIALGIGYNVNSYLSDFDTQQVKDKVKRLWENPEFLSRIGSGSDTAARIRSNVPLGVGCSPYEDTVAYSTGRGFGR